MTTSRASRASTGGSVLPGGAVGQVLTKRSGTNDDLAWGDINTTTYNNPTATGLVTAQAAGSNVEAVVSGMSVSNLQPGVVVSVNLLLYVSMNDFGTAKGVTMRLRDGGLTGTILQSVVRSLTTDTSTGHDQNFAFTGNVTPATNTLVVTVQRTSASTVAVLSDTRTFTVSQSGGGFTPIGGTTGQVLTKTSSTDLAYGWATPAAGGGGGGSTAVTTGTDTTLAATPQVLAQSAKSQVFGTTTLSPLVDTLLVIHVTANISSAGGNQGAFLGPLVASPQTGGQFGGRFSAGPAPVSPGITSMNQTIQNPLSGSLFADTLYYLRAGVTYTIGYDLQAGSGVGSVTFSNLQATYSTTPFGSGVKTVNTQTGTAYTLVLSDANNLVDMNNVAASTLTVPPNSSVAFSVGTIIEGNQLGAGQVTLTPGAGVTINATPGLKVAAQYGTYGLRKVATDTWLAYGRLSA
jgi:hypothetical protein